MTERINGRFAPGHRKLGGRKPSTVKQDYLEAMVERWTPADTLDDLDWVIEESKRKGWVKPVLSACELKLFLLYGKPKQSVEIAKGGLADILDQLSGGSE